jgi:hypothetical protein
MRGGAPLGRRGKTHGLDSWRRSARFRSVAQRSCQANNAAFRKAPRCGAKRKGGGVRCLNPVVKGRTRCRLHGGATGQGSKWHTILWPDRSTPAGAAKFNRKLRQHERYAAERAERLAGMTPERRAKYDAWVRTHQPGSGAARSAKRARAAQNAQAQVLVNLGPPQPTTDPESIQIETALCAARAKLALLEARTAKSNDDNEGVFA